MRLVFAVVCAIIVRALGAHMIRETESLADAYYSYAALGVATGVLTFVTLPVMYVTSYIEHN